MGFEWDERKIRWYMRALPGAEYPSALLPFFRRLLCPGDTVLDLGAGTGPIALLVAPLVSRVVAMDTSGLALAALETAALARGLGNVSIRQIPWQEVAVQGDVVVSAYAALPEDISSLFALDALARRAVVLVVPQNRARTEFGVHRLLGRLGLELLRRKTVARDVCRLLDKAGFRYQHLAMRCRFDQPLMSVAEAVEFIMAHYGLEESCRPEVERFAAETVVVQDETLVLPNLRLLEIIWWLKPPT